LGKRYAFAALELMGKELLCDTAYNLTYGYKNFYLAKSVNMEVPESMSAMPGQYIGHNISATATFKDNHKEDVSGSLIFNSEDLVINNGVLSPKYEGSGAVEVIYMDFLRNELKKSRKIFFYDNGVRNAVVQNFAPLALRADTGALWENFFISERLKANHYAGRYAKSYFWRTKSQQEIDYVEECDGTFRAFELKWNPKRNTAAIPAAFTQAYPVSEAVVVTPDNYLEYL
jgi:hypothetical protein